MSKRLPAFLFELIVQHVHCNATSASEQEVLISNVAQDGVSGNFE